MDARFYRVDVYWFSGSGNTLIVAEEIAAALASLGSEVELKALDRSDPRRVDPERALGIVVPVAGQGTYPFVWDFLEALPGSEGRACFLADTLGSYSGGIVGPVGRILRRKGYDIAAAIEIRMPSTLSVKESNTEVDAALVERGREEARRFAAALAEGRGRWRDIPVYSDLMSLFFRRRKAVERWRRYFPRSVDSGACRSCGLCARLCPERAISTDAATGLPIVTGSCVICKRCSAFCPAGAIRIGAPGAASYRAVPLGEMLSALGERAAAPGRP